MAREPWSRRRRVGAGPRVRRRAGRVGGLHLRHRRADHGGGGRRRGGGLRGVGGSATTDGGAGAIRAVADAGGLRGARLVVLSDVRTPFERAAVVYGPQKGADPDAVRRLTKRLHGLAGTCPRDPRAADDGRGRRHVRRPVGGAGGGHRVGGGVRARRAGLRRAPALGRGRDHGRGQARRADAAGQACGRGGDAVAAAGRAVQRGRGRFGPGPLRPPAAGPRRRHRGRDAGGDRGRGRWRSATGCRRWRG